MLTHGTWDSSIRSDSFPRRPFIDDKVSLEPMNTAGGGSCGGISNQSNIVLLLFTEQIHVNSVSALLTLRQHLSIFMSHNVMARPAVTLRLSLVDSFHPSVSQYYAWVCYSCNNSQTGPSQNLLQLATIWTFSIGAWNHCPLKFNSNSIPFYWSLCCWRTWTWTGEQQTTTRRKEQAWADGRHLVRRGTSRLCSASPILLLLLVGLAPGITSDTPLSSSTQFSPSPSIGAHGVVLVSLDSVIMISRWGG